MKSFLRFLAVSLVVCAPLASYSAIIPDLPNLRLSISPLYPRSGELVVVKVTNASRDGESTVYVWKVNGVVIEQGAGVTSITMPAGRSGDVSVVSVEAVSGQASGDVATTIVRPADVEIIWEGVTAVPPLYKGLPLPNAQSAVRVAAIPHIVHFGTALRPEELIYRWSVNGSAFDSGYGKQSVSVVPPAYGSAFTVSVRVESPDAAISAENTTSIQPREPDIVFYRHEPLLGTLFNRAIGTTFVFEGDEVSMFAQPLNTDLSGSLSYTRKVNNELFETDAVSPFLATFKKIGAGVGSHRIEFSLADSDRFLVSAARSFQLTF